MVRQHTLLSALLFSNLLVVETMPLMILPDISLPIPALGISQLVSHVTLNMIEHISHMGCTRG